MKNKWFLLMIFIIGVCVACGSNSLQKQLDLGQKYLQAGSYEQALAAFQAAIEVDAKCEAAYLGAADAYIGLQNEEAALELLETAYEKVAGDGIFEKAKKICLDYAQKLEQEGKSDVAVRWLERILKLREDEELRKLLEELRKKVTGDFEPEGSEQTETGTTELMKLEVEMANKIQELANSLYLFDKPYYEQNLESLISEYGLKKDDLPPEMAVTYYGTDADGFSCSVMIQDGLTQYVWSDPKYKGLGYMQHGINNNIGGKYEVDLVLSVGNGEALPSGWAFNDSPFYSFKDYNEILSYLKIDKYLELAEPDQQYDNESDGTAYYYILSPDATISMPGHENMHFMIMTHSGEDEMIQIMMFADMEFSISIGSEPWGDRGSYSLYSHMIK